MPAEKSSIRNVFSLKLFLFSMFCLLISIAMFACVEPLESGHKIWAAIFREVGSAVLVALGLGVFWEVYGKRAYTDELFEKAHISQSLAAAGIVRFTTFRSTELEWDSLFESSQTLDMFVAYAATWRNTQVDRINAMLSTSTGSIRIVLPDPENARLVGELAHRFSIEANDMEGRIRSAAAFFLERQLKAVGNMNIRFTSEVPLYSYYIFRSGAIFAFFNHKSDKEEPVPAIQANKNGSFYPYLQKQFDVLYASSRRS
jgi:hypothetical protein